MQLQISEIFKSIQGESTLAGTPCTFIRLTGCNLRCRYCDTAYAYEGGEYLSIDDIISRVDEYNSSMVEITGGEPLLQDAVYTLIKTLLGKNKEVLIETNGSIDIKRVKPLKDSIRGKGARGQGAKIIMDIKCPDSGMSEKMNWENLSKLSKNDEVKFVLSSRNDYNWSKEIIKRYSLIERCPVLLSPAYGMLDSKELSEWMTRDNMNVRLNLQIHKYIWGKGVRGV
ncbi:MAG: radical SAM protein [Nitrospinae bacterium]|nr:radical SAM protein [Nitrospinota bacterium]MBI3815497.1 radical SAM protein [Nitrospinota bacterium]